MVEAPSAAGGGWVFGRVGEGYIGLYSHRPYKWAQTGPESGQEIVADGHENIWICQVGRKKTDGAFEAFVQKLSKAKIEASELDVSYEAPGTGKVRFGWKEPLTVEGKTIPLHDYPRWDNAYAHVEFGSEHFHMEFQGEKLDLDFKNGVRAIA